MESNEIQMKKRSMFTEKFKQKWSDFMNWAARKHLVYELDENGNPIDFDDDEYDDDDSDIPDALEQKDDII